jgi:hypothetical protein
MGKWHLDIQKKISTFNLTVKDDQGQRTTLKRLEAEEAERTLGARIAPTGSCEKEKCYLRDCAVAWADHIRTGKLPRFLTWQGLLTTIMKKLTFPLMVTTFTQSECNFIMAPVLRVALSSSGVVNTIPHALVYAPLCFQGLNIPDLFTEQGISKIVRLVKYGRQSQHITSCLIRHNCEAMKMEFGINGQLFQHDPVQWDAMITPSWLKFTWKFLVKHDVQLIDDLPDFPALREHDRPIMAVFGDLGWSDKLLYRVNICRMFLQVITLADIATGDGKRISYDAWTGKRTIRNTKYNWPFQPYPPPSFWDTWRTALATLCSRQYILKTPLGRWTQDGKTTAIWWFDKSTESLYQAAPTPITFPFKSTRSTRHAELRFNATRTTPSQIPHSAIPCTVSRQGDFWLFQGSADVVDSPNAMPPDSTFQQFIEATPMDRWVYDNVQFLGSMEELGNAISNGSCTCVADGSFKDNHGTAAWKILDLDNPDNSIDGQCVTPGDPSHHNPYRSELSGLYAAITMINSLVEYLKIEQGSMTLACDNLGAITFTEYHPEGTNPSTCAQFDLVMAIQKMKTTKITWHHVHVYGHQDTKSANPLSPIELINVEMDRPNNTGKRHNMFLPPVGYCPFPGNHGLSV